MDRVKLYGYTALIVSALATVVYLLAVTRTENAASLDEVAPWAAVMLVIIVSTALATSTRSDATRRRAFLTSTILATITGLLGILSFGILLLVAAALTFVGFRTATPVNSDR